MVQITFSFLHTGLYHFLDLQKMKSLMIIQSIKAGLWDWTCFSFAGKIKLLSSKDNGDGSYLVEYSASAEGPHSIMVKYTNDDCFRR